MAPWAGCPGQSCQVILVDALSFTQGLDGAKGEKGDSGEKGDHGDAGPAVSCFPVSRVRPYSNHPNALLLFFP